MNIIILFESDFIGHGKVKLAGRRFGYIKKVHRASAGDFLFVGLLNGQMGKGLVIKITDRFVEMEVVLDIPPPEALPLVLVLALPRPKAVRRIIQAVTCLGIKTIYLINSWRVEKSFWSSPVLKTENVEKELILGLEQAKDTMMPEIFFKPLFKPFVLEELPLIAEKTIALTAHPKSFVPCPKDVAKPVTLVIGPEGGFIDIEIKTLEKSGFKTVSLGKRILRTETAVPVLISRLTTLR